MALGTITVASEEILARLDTFANWWIIAHFGVAKRFGTG
jgi:hypothetical protein